jgi:hypothetical protein
MRDQDAPLGRTLLGIGSAAFCISLVFISVIFFITVLSHELGSTMYLYGTWSDWRT